jgi:DNA topoisomerase I
MPGVLAWAVLRQSGMTTTVKRLRRVAPQDLGSAPLDSAKAAGLRYVVPGRAGIRRRRTGRGFMYLDAEGHVVREAETLRRIRALAIPPAWNEVWIAAAPHAHVQAVGRDARGRRQYRYHQRWRSIRDETKYSRMIAFAEQLPRIRLRVEKDLAQAGLPRAKVLAAVVRLLERTLVRVGNDEYARTNGSFGLTTLRNRHVDVSGGTIRFEFRGKGGKPHAVGLHDPRLARVVRRCRDLPGYELFQYVDEHGERQAVSSDDVNAYLREVAGEEFTAKDFRTWAGTVLAAHALAAVGVARTSREARSKVVRAVTRVAEHLGNTPAISRKSYIHPHVLEAYAEGVTVRPNGTAAHLSRDEACVVALLRRRLRAVA